MDKTKLIADLCEERVKFNECLLRNGLRARQVLNTSVEHLETLSLEHLRSTFDTLRLYRSIFLRCEEERRDLKETRYLLKLTLDELGMKTSDDFLDTLEPDDLVEGFGMDQRQFFRNFQFMEICGYDLTDLLTYDWMTLYERNSGISDEMLRRVEIVCKTGKTLSLMDIPTHYMKERLSENRQVCKVRFRYMGPIFRGAGEPAGVLVSSKATIVDDTPDRHVLRFI